ncbi:heavy metal translocating P-type ATPase [Succinatimonas hippei]|uniref:P-type Zn(2+) transporter n=1 Tax=Succinatimonas hippei (strain DSM 22608 / JCM 16073 / KCTC 15190 / YIT 12066) TaxID=762983 RepID=E8LJ63_SUCHY|nr:heavy metal translocating P-type ATPase [Succinatimonas hippei]EFY07440.1 cadmium-exporting ATPase [Succinatimonas hippei YIT 12066]
MLQSIDLKTKLRLSFALIVMLMLLLKLDINSYLKLALFALAYVAVAYETVIAAFKTLFKRFRMSEQFLMSVATFGAIALGDYAEALAVLIFYEIGEIFEEYASGRSHKEITSLIALKPQIVRVIDKDGNELKVKPRKVKVGQTIRVLAGEAVALDGTLKNDSAAVDMSALTGESEPFLYKKGEEIPSGGINMGSVIELTVTKDNSNSSITRLIELIEDAAANKSKPEALISRFAVYYTPLVVTCAIILALVPLFVAGESFSDWIERALVFLVVSCPCALVLSVPLSFFGGLGAISKIGVMVKGSIHIETLSKLTVLALDKTGTITQGKFKPADFIVDDGSSKSELLSCVYALESATTHPIGTAIVNYCKINGVELKKAEAIHEVSGYGIEGIIDGKKVAVGSREFIEKITSRTDLDQSNVIGTEVLAAVDGRFIGGIVLNDEPKAGALEFFGSLKSLGITSCMITGDKESVAANIAKRLGIEKYYAKMLPEDKLKAVKDLKTKSTAVVGFVGDGINDAPVLAASDVGIAMGQFGSASAVEASDVVVMNDDLRKIPQAISLARRTYKLAMQNIVFVIACKLLILVLGAMGIAGIWVAIFGDVGLCVLAVLNAMRALTWVKVKRGGTIS